MGRPLGIVACALALAAAAAASTDAQAADARCELELRGDRLGADWSHALEAIREEAGAGLELDSCARVVVSPEAAGARVRVILGDGRTAARFVATPDDLRASLVALLMVSPVPEQDAPEPAKPEPETAVPLSLAAPAPAPIPTEERVAAAPPSANRATPIRMDIGLGGGARWEGGQPGGAAIAFGDVSLGHWLIGVNGRWDRAGGPQGSAASAGYSLQTLEVGAELGYRLDFGPWAFAAVLGPSVAAVAQQLDPGTGGLVVDPKNGALMPPPGRDARVGRMDIGLRATLAASAPLLVFASADASFDVTHDSANDLPLRDAGTAALPTWTAGLSLGAQLRVWP